VKLHTVKAPARILVLAGMSYFVFWACAPMMSAPPAPPIPPPTTGETGHGIWGGANLRGDHVPDGMGGYQYWKRAPNGDGSRVESGMLFGLGFPSTITAGGYSRFGIIKGERGYLGVQGAAGFIWLNASIPAAVKVSDTTWLTTQPSYSHSAIRAIRVPVGMSWEKNNFGRIDTEVGVQFINMSMQNSDPPNVRESIKHMSGLAPYVGIGYSKAFGATQDTAQ